MRKNSTTGYLAAIKALYEHAAKNGIESAEGDRKRMADAGAALLAPAGEPQDDATALVNAAKFLIEAADDIVAKATGKEGFILCSLDFEDTYQEIEDCFND